MNRTSMPGRVQRWPLFVSLAALIVVATVAVVDMSRSDELPVIRLASGGTTEMAATARADVAMESPASVAVNRFEVADAVRFPAGEATAYRLEPPDDLAAAVAELAAHLGLRPDVDASSFGDGGYQVGADDRDGPSLWVGPFGDWNFDDPSGQPQIRCGEPDGGGGAGEPGDAAAPPEPADRAEPSDAAEPQERELLIDDAVVAPCEPAAPPTGIPDEAAALDAAEAFLAGLELAGTPRVAEVYADQWGAWVTATVFLDEVDSDVHVSVGLGPGAVVTSASATLARPVEAGRYPTIDAQAAVDRLEGQQAWSGAVLGPQTARLPSGDMAVETGEASVTESRGDDVSILPAPEPDAEPEVRMVTLVAAEPAAVLTVDADGSVWLLPGVRFSDQDGVVWQVLTIADEYLDEAPVDPRPAPMPIEPAPEPDGRVPVEPDPGQPDTDVQALADAVVGLAEPDAVEHIEAAGLVARVIARDGEELVVTNDLRPDRINLRVDRERVVEASVG